MYRNYLKEADEKFQQGEFYEAAELYKYLVDKDAPSPGGLSPYQPGRGGKVRRNNKEYDRISYQLAEASRLYHHYEDARRWYQEVLDNEEFPLARLYYGVSLRALADYKTAVSELESFLDSYGKKDEYTRLAEHELRNCRYGMEKMEDTPVYNTFRAPEEINEGTGNYGSVITGPDKILFTSTRFIAPAKEALTGKGNFNNVYEATRSEEMLSDPRLYNIPYAQGFHQGALTITPDGNTIYLTRWKGNATGVSESAVYVSKYTYGDWSEPQKLSGDVNVAGYKSLHPSVSTDGKYLFFVSNRPGGQGGNDIWYTEIRSNGNLGPARNAGSEVNTPANEESPYYQPETQTLYFSADGLTGFGGFDVYRSDGKPGKFSEPANLGYSLNSSRDDMHYTPLDRHGSKGFVSSDRESVCCLELFSFEVADLRFAASGKVVDCDERTPLQGVAVKLFDPEDNLLQEVVTSGDGSYFFTLNKEVRNYKMALDKKGYISIDHEFPLADITLSDTLDVKELCMQKIEIDRPFVLSDIYYDYNKATLRPESERTLDSLAVMLLRNNRLVVELSAHADSIGSDAYNMALSQRRAQSCVDYLILNGIAEDRLIAKGYGESMPVAPNSKPDGSDNPEGRQLNRRTEFKIVRVNE